MEILVGSAAVRNLIREKKDHHRGNVLTTGRKEGMQSLDQHLKELVEDGSITAEEAMQYTKDPIPGISTAGNREQKPAMSKVAG